MRDVLGPVTSLTSSIKTEATYNVAILLHLHSIRGLAFGLIDGVRDVRAFDGPYRLIIASQVKIFWRENVLKL